MTGGCDLFTYYVNINDSYTDAEIDAVFAGAKLLGARVCRFAGFGCDETRRAIPGQARDVCRGSQSRQPVRPRRLQYEESFVKGLGSRRTFTPRSTRATSRRRTATASVFWRSTTIGCRAFISEIAGKTMGEARHLVKATRRSSKCCS